MRGSKVQGTARQAMQMAATAIAITLALWPAMVPLFVALLLICAIWTRLTEGPWARRLGPESPLFWSSLLFAFYLIGLAWTANMEFAGLDLGIKSSLLLFALMPLIGAPAVGRPLVVRAFVSANALAVVFCIVRAVVRSLAYILQVKPQEHLSGYTLSVPFFASDFSFFLHPTYMAMYLTLALILMTGTYYWKGVARPLKVVAAVLLLIGVVLCASKAGWIILFLAAGASLGLRWSDHRMRRVLTAGTLVMLAACASLYMGTEFVHERVGQVLDTFREATPTSDAANSTDDRRLVWRASAALVSDHPWTGVGTGDVKDELLKVYAERGYVEPLRKKLNAHDQYLNTGVALGIGGIVLLLLMIMVPTLVAFRRRNVLLASFLLLNALNWTVESMLEVQAGTIFFAFFAWLLTLDESRPSQRKIHS